MGQLKLLVTTFNLMDFHFNKKAAYKAAFVFYV